MRQFVADASHELRTPLTTIRGFAELYRQGAAGPPEDTARLVRRIEDEAARMGLLVEDLLAARPPRPGASRGARPGGAARAGHRGRAGGPGGGAGPGGRARGGPRRRAAGGARRRRPAAAGARQPGDQRAHAHPARHRRSRCGCAPRAARRSSRSPTPARACRRSSGIASSSGSTGWTPRAPATTAPPARVSDSRSWRRSCRRTAARSRWTASPGVGATFRVLLPLVPENEDPENDDDAAEPDDTGE